MTTPVSNHRVALIDQMAAEWQSIGRAERATRSLRAIAGRDPRLAALVFGPPEPPPCPTPYDLVEHMRGAQGRARREDAAHVVRVLLREGGSDPFITRMLVQALLPGLVAVAGKLRWGQGGEWQDGTDFFGELLSTTWLVVEEWAGQDRRYAVLDLLSAIRCRLRRQLFRSKEMQARVTSLPELGDRIAMTETDLELLARTLIDRYREGMRVEEVQVLYAHHVLGFSIAELAAVTGRDRRAVYARRDRGRRRMCA